MGVDDRVLKMAEDGGLAAEDVVEDPPNPGEMNLSISGANIAEAEGSPDYLMALVSDVVKKIAYAPGLAASVFVVGTGGSYTTISDALTAAGAATPSVVLVCPGTYAESRLVIPAGVSLIGIDPATCVVAKSDNPGGQGWTGAIVKASESCVIANLTLRNLANTYTSCAAWLGNGTTSKTIRMFNCILDGGSLGWDALITDGTGHTIELYNCTVLGYADTAGCYLSANAVHRFVGCNLVSYRATADGPSTAVWATGSGTLVFESTYISYAASSSTRGGGIRGPIDHVTFGTGLKVHLLNCTIDGPSRATGRPIEGTEDSNPSGSWSVYLRHTAYGELIPSGASHQDHFTFNTEDLGAGNKETDGCLDVGSLKVGGTEVVSSAREVKAAGLNNTETKWIDIPALEAKNIAPYGAATTHAHGESGVTVNDAGHYHTAGEGNTSTDVTGITLSGYDADEKGLQGGYWIPNALTGATHLNCVVTGVGCYLPVPKWLVGSIISKLRVKWQAQGANDGVKIRLLKRDESSTDTAWTVCGSQQTYTDSGAPYDVTVSEYDIADVTLVEGYSYLIEVESVKAATGVNFFAVGIQTTKRVY